MNPKEWCWHKILSDNLPNYDLIQTPKLTTEKMQQSHYYRDNSNMLTQIDGDVHLNFYLINGLYILKTSYRMAIFSMRL